MAEIDVNPIFQGIRNKVGNLVFYRRNGETCMRTLGSVKKSSTPAQVKVRSTFSMLIDAWNGISGIVQSGWNALATRNRMTGFNAFMKHNFSACFEGAAVRLSAGIGDLAPVTLNAASGVSGEISCEFSPAPLTDGRHLVLFYQKISGEQKSRPLEHIDFGENAASPVSITGLEPGATYAVYAVVTDSAFAESSAVSESSGVIGTSGEPATVN
ncbi:MAG TPA: DUF6266 family protein [Spirochaetota bacterium]|nr:DUF6266 family protein [Spirochaetota bacterium]HPI88458.1 DUF6266 family protein [Spirochaetota bacterium]HPR48821.1 DUF6266 family protein [Spirochaetota bacterium]